MDVHRYTRIADFDAAAWRADVDDSQDGVRAGATVTTTRPVFEAVILEQRTLSDALNAGEMTARGNANAVRNLWALPVDFPPGFSLVAPAEDRPR